MNMLSSHTQTFPNAYGVSRYSLCSKLLNYSFVSFLLIYAVSPPPQFEPFQPSPPNKFYTQTFPLPLKLLFSTELLENCYIALI